MDYEDEFYCGCTDMGCEECEEEGHCNECMEMNLHNCTEAGCYGENPNAHIEVFGTYAPGSEFDNYYNND